MSNPLGASFVPEEAGLVIDVVQVVEFAGLEICGS